MTTTAIIIACMAVIVLCGVARRQAGRAVTDLALLVFICGVLTVLDLIFSRFMDTGDAAKSVALFFAAAIAVDWIYGLLAPERQRQRDRKLRELMRRRRA